MMMKIVPQVCAALVISSVDFAQAVRCGKWFSHSCLGETDKRYDPDYPTEYFTQDSRWERNSGFFRVVGRAFDENDEIVEPSVYDPTDQPFPDGFPYPRDPFVAYYNNTYVGSRLESNRYYLYSPAPRRFCLIPTIPGQLNVFGDGECGVNGFARPAGFFATTTFEKDGSGQTFSTFGDYARGYDSIDRFVDDNTIYGFGNSNITSRSTTEVFLDSNRTERDTIVTFFILDDETFVRWRFHRLEIVSITEEEFIQGIQSTYVEFNILPEDQWPVPFNTSALVPDAYPSESEWREYDPEYATSPYEEPDGTVKAGVIAGFSILGFAIILVGLYFFYRYRLRQQEKRFKDQFVRRLASSMSLKCTPATLESDDLLKEFKKISSDGRYISKQDLYDFVQTEKAGKLSDKDFNAMWTALDVDSNGSVDFIEFCTFIGHCGTDMADPKTLELMTAEEKMNFAARSLKRSIHRLNSVPGKDVKTWVVENDGVGMLLTDDDDVRTC